MCTVDRRHVERNLSGPRRHEVASMGCLRRYHDTSSTRVASSVSLDCRTRGTELGQALRNFGPIGVGTAGRCYEVHRGL
jgi:hypothetical protein